MNDASDAQRRKARLRWLCRRGMRELDIVVGAFLEQRYDAAGARQQAAFRRLLDLPDPQLFGYLTDRERPDDDDLCELIDVIKTINTTDPGA